MAGSAKPLDFSSAFVLKAEPKPRSLFYRRDLGALQRLLLLLINKLIRLQSRTHMCQVSPQQLGTGGSPEQAQLSRIDVRVNIFQCYGFCLQKSVLEDGLTCTLCNLITCKINSHYSFPQAK